MKSFVQSLKTDEILQKLTMKCWFN